MTAAVPPRGPARHDATRPQAASGVAHKALLDLAVLAAEVCGAPSAAIHSESAGDRRLIAACGDETGETFPFQTVIPITAGSGRPLGTLSILNRAVTEVSSDQSRLLSGLARQAAALLELGGESPAQAAPIEDQFHDILDLIPDAVIVHAKGKVIFANAAAARLSGARDVSELEGMPVASMFAPENREMVEGRIEDLYQRGLPTARRAVRYRRRDGKEMLLEAASLAIRLGGEECRMAVVRDMSFKVEAEDSLRDKEKRFELIARATNDAVWEHLPGSEETWWNQQAYRLFGYDPATTAPSLEAWKQRLHPEDRDRVLLSVKKIASGDADTWVREYRFVRTDGSTGHIYERGYVVRGEGGLPFRLLGAMLDITELKRAEELVRESEEKYRKLVEVLPDVIAIMVDGRISFVNQAGLIYHGVERAEEILGRPALDFFHPDSREIVKRRLEQLDSGSEIPPMELKFLRKDGTTIEAESRAIAFPFQGQRAKLAVIRDITARKQAEAALRSSEERYRLLFQSNPQPMWLFDQETLRFLDVNETAMERYGYSREEFLAMDLRGIWPAADAPAFEASMKTLTIAREFIALRRHRRKNGTIIHAEVSYHLIEFSGQAAVIALANDITEKLETLERLRHSEERYRTLATVSPVGLYRTDTQGRVTYVNDHLCGILARNPEELTGRDAAIPVHPDDIGWVSETWQEASRLGAPFRAEYRLRRPDGRVVWVMGNAQADAAADGSHIGWVGTITDITERKHAEILLACQKRTLSMVASGWHMQDVLDSLAQYVERESSGGMGCVLQVDSEGAFLLWSSAPALPESFRREVPHFPVHYRAGGAPGQAAFLKELSLCPDIEAETGWTAGRTEALAHGLKSCASRPIIGSRGQVLGVFAFFYRRPGEPAAYDLKLIETASDLAAITIERWRQEEISRKNQELSEQNRRIEEASRMKSEFLANMSHELRTPLNAIIGFSQLLIDRKVGPMNEKQTEYLGDILDGGMHLLRLINDVLDLAKIEAGKMQLFLEPINVAQSIREVCDILMPMALGKGVTLHASAQPGTEVAWLDAQKLRQVLYNLVSNAIKFSKEDGTVSVVAVPGAEGGLRLQVIDHGIGIRQEDIGKLFQQFQQLDSGSARHYPGTGLGLVITKKLVELHRGTVEVESEPGRGSVFTAVFPRLSGEESVA
jgi:PAS domain S-box-containing protein